MAGEENRDDKAQQRMDLAQEIGVLGEIRALITSWDASLDEDPIKEEYRDALQAIIDRNSKFLATGA